jgi:hypothetical protein
MTVVGDLLLKFRGDASDLQASVAAVQTDLQKLAEHPQNIATGLDAASQSAGGFQTASSGLTSIFSSGGAGDALKSGFGDIGAVVDSLKGKMLGFVAEATGAAGLGALVNIAKDLTGQLQVLGVQFDATFGPQGAAMLKQATTFANDMGITQTASAAAFQAVGLATKGIPGVNDSQIVTTSQNVAAGTGQSVDNIAQSIGNYVQLIQREGGQGGIGGRAATSLLEEHVIDPETYNVLRAQANAGYTASQLLQTILSDANKTYAGAGAAYAQTLPAEFQTLKNTVAEQAQNIFSPIWGGTTGGASGGAGDFIKKLTQDLKSSGFQDFEKEMRQVVTDAVQLGESLIKIGDAAVHMAAGLLPAVDAVAKLVTEVVDFLSHNDAMMKALEALAALMILKGPLTTDAGGSAIGAAATSLGKSFGLVAAPTPTIAPEVEGLTTAESDKMLIGYLLAGGGAAAATEGSPGSGPTTTLSALGNLGSVAPSGDADEIAKHIDGLNDHIDALKTATVGGLSQVSDGVGNLPGKLASEAEMGAMMGGGLGSAEKATSPLTSFFKSSGFGLLGGLGGILLSQMIPGKAGSSDLGDLGALARYTGTGAAAGFLAGDLLPLGPITGVPGAAIGAGLGALYGAYQDITKAPNQTSVENLQASNAANAWVNEHLVTSIPAGGTGYLTLQNNALLAQANLNAIQAANSPQNNQYAAVAAADERQYGVKLFTPEGAAVGAATNVNNTWQNNSAGAQKWLEMIETLTPNHTEASALQWATNNNWNFGTKFDPQTNPQAIQQMQALTSEVAQLGQISAATANTIQTLGSAIAGEQGQTSIIPDKSRGWGTAMATAKQLGIDVTPYEFNPFTGGQVNTNAPVVPQQYAQQMANNISSQQSLIDAMHSVTEASDAEYQAQFSLGQAQFSAKEAVFQQTRDIFQMSVAQTQGAEAVSSFGTAMTSDYVPAFAQAGSTVMQLVGSHKALGDIFMNEVAIVNKLEASYQAANLAYTEANNALTVMTDKVTALQVVANEPLQGSKAYAGTQEAFTVREAAIDQQMQALKLMNVPSMDPRMIQLQYEMNIAQAQAALSTDQYTQSLGKQQFAIQQAQLGPEVTYQAALAAADSIGHLNDSIFDQQQDVDNLKTSVDSINESYSIQDQKANAMYSALQNVASEDQAIINQTDGLRQAANAVKAANESVYEAELGMRNASWGYADALASMKEATWEAKGSISANFNAMMGTIVNAVQTGYADLESGSTQLTALQKAQGEFMSTFFSDVMNIGTAKGLATFNQLIAEGENNWVNQYLQNTSGGQRPVKSKVPRPNAEGGVFEDHTAQIAAAGSTPRIWAEPETGGEAYIPLSMSKRGQSMAILQQVAGLFGVDSMGFSDGGIRPIGSVPMPSTSTSSTTTIHPGAIQLGGVHVHGSNLSPDDVADCVDDRLNTALGQLITQSRARGGSLT